MDLFNWNTWFKRQFDWMSSSSLLFKERKWAVCDATWYSMLFSFFFISSNFNSNSNSNSNIHWIISICSSFSSSIFFFIKLGDCVCNIYFWFIFYWIALLDQKIKYSQFCFGNWWRTWTWRRWRRWGIWRRMKKKKKMRRLEKIVLNFQKNKLNFYKEWKEGLKMKKNEKPSVPVEYLKIFFVERGISSWWTFFFVNFFLHQLLTFFKLKIKDKER